MKEFIKKNRIVVLSFMFILMVSAFFIKNYLGSSLAADTFVLSDFTYNKNDSSLEIVLTKYNGTASNVSIPSIYKVNSKTYKIILDSPTSRTQGLFSGNTSIKSVTFSGPVKAKSLKRMFSNCTNLQSVINFGDIDTSSVDDEGKIDKSNLNNNNDSDDDEGNRNQNKKNKNLSKK